MKKFFANIGITAVVVAVIGLPIFFGATPTGRTVWNNWTHRLEKVDEKNYENRKKVEDACRAMIASYNQDKLVYEQYKDSDVEEERSWANNAKIRANNTASTYNSYILKNSYVWADNVPYDIKMELPFVK